MTRPPLRSDGGDVVAKMSLQVDRKRMDKELKRVQETKEEAITLERVLTESVATGMVGNLQVNPQYLVVQPRKGRRCSPVGLLRRDFRGFGQLLLSS